MIGAILLMIFLLVFMRALGLNMGRLFGHVEEWHYDCDLEAWGKFYNGRKIHYVLFVPVYRQGFYHSTNFID